MFNSLVLLWSFVSTVILLVVASKRVFEHSWTFRLRSFVNISIWFKYMILSCSILFSWNSRLTSLCWTSSYFDFASHFWWMADCKLLFQRYDVIFQAFNFKVTSFNHFHEWITFINNSITVFTIFLNFCFKSFQCFWLFDDFLTCTNDNDSLLNSSKTLSRTSSTITWLLVPPAIFWSHFPWSSFSIPLRYYF